MVSYFLSMYFHNRFVSSLRFSGVVGEWGMSHAYSKPGGLCDAVLSLPWGTQFANKVHVHRCSFRILHRDTQSFWDAVSTHAEMFSLILSKK